MNLIKVSDLFYVKYGVNLELNRLELDSKGVNFVSRTAKNNGVSARVKIIPNIEPIEAGVITVAGGGSVMESFLQPEPFYSGRDLYFLKPKVHLTTQEKLYYCVCLPNPAISPPESGAIRHPIPGKSPPVIGAKRRWFFSSFS